MVTHFVRKEVKRERERERESERERGFGLGEKRQQSYYETKVDDGFITAVESPFQLQA